MYCQKPGRDAGTSAANHSKFWPWQDQHQFPAIRQYKTIAANLHNAIQIKTKFKMKIKGNTNLTVALCVSVVAITGCNNQSNIQQSGSSGAEIENNKDMATNNLIEFGKNYAKAWCSQKPDNVAEYFSDSGSLTVNKGTPAIGRVAISNVAKSFMTAFPDLIVVMDSLTTTSKGVEFHWTLTGTNTGPNGTGKKVKVSGFEVWQLDDKGLIKQSLGSFNAEEYNRQIKYGVNQ